MSFRRRLVIASGVAVSVAVVLASLVVYFVVRAELRGQVDEALRRFAAGVFAIRIDRTRAPEEAGAPRGKIEIRGGPLRNLSPQDRRELLRVRLPRDALGGLTGYAQFVDAGGKVIGPFRRDVPLAITERTKAVARGEEGAFYADAEINGEHARVYTRNVGDGRAVQAARSLTEVDETLDRLALVLVLVSAGGIGLSVVLGLLVGRTALRPVQRLTEAAEHVASTRDLSRRIESGGRDELSRLARSFNTMLAALERSLGAQRQLVADASHELRTPLTSLRTNVEVLAAADRLHPDERERLLADVSAQLEDLTELVGDVVELARDEGQPRAEEDVRLDEVVAAAVARAARDRPGLRIDADLEPCLLRGDPSRLHRAVANLLDNAGKWSPAGGEVAVSLRGGVLEVRDQGPGFDEADLPHVFDRFYRSTAARGQPGSGLGLAIVRQVAESHGGTVSAGNVPGGGGLLRVRLPTTPVDAPAERALATS